MIETVAASICDYLIRKEIIQQDIEVYAFGLRIIIAYLIECTIVLILSILFDSILTGIIYIILFAKTRDYSGGYHANTYLGCICSFTLLFIFQLICIEYVPIEFLMVTSIFSMIGLIVLTPVKHPNKNFDLVSVNEKKRELCLLYFWKFW